MIAIALVSHMSWTQVFILSQCFGGVINHPLMLAIHEIAHNLGFGHNKPIADRAFGIIANLPVGQSFTVAFKNYRLEH